MIKGNMLHVYKPWRVGIPQLDFWLRTNSKNSPFFVFKLVRHREDFVRSGEDIEYRDGTEKPSNIEQRQRLLQAHLELLIRDEANGVEDTDIVFISDNEAALRSLEQDVLPDPSR